jgi:hypothetical protein
VEPSEPRPQAEGGLYDPVQLVDELGTFEIEQTQQHASALTLTEVTDQIVVL